jgi:hypothetical protein
MQLLKSHFKSQFGADAHVYKKIWIDIQATGCASFKEEA